jgi:hypothetical protein
MDIREELNEPPARRITIPQGHVAVLLPNVLFDEVRSMCKLIRAKRRPDGQEKNQMQSIAGSLLLALIDAEDQ